MNKPIANPIAHFTDLLLDAICMVDAGGRFVFVSAACERIFGYTQEEMIGKVMIDMVAPSDRERTLAAAASIMSGEPATRFENRYVRKDGSLVHIMWSARWSESDQLRVAVARDITASKEAAEKQAALYAIAEAAHGSEELAPLFPKVHQIIGGLLPVACVGIALQTEPGQPLYFAYSADASGATAPMPLARALCDDVLACGQLLYREDGASGERWTGVPLSTAKQHLGVLVLRCAADESGFSAHDQDLLEFVAAQVATAIERKQLVTRLHFMAQHDELTQLPNRRLFHDRLVTALARTQRQQGRLALLFVDLDKFKLVNDKYGHSAGDRLLQEVAQRLKGCVREADTVARLGGDEFVVLLENVAERDNVKLIEEKIHATLSLEIVLSEAASLAITASIGIAHYPEHGSDIHQLVRHADQAMYAAKAPMAACLTE
jgi:diguanylate cyclase (GGDEF)-like protein/PAS domain S-box-containing protein